MLDDRFDDQLRDAARDYNAPPETPREEMWAAIQARRAETEKTEKTEKTEGSRKGVIPFRPLRHLRPFRLPIGIAALLALGIGLGRFTAPAPTTPAQPTIVAAPAPHVSDVAYRSRPPNT